MLPNTLKLWESSDPEHTYRLTIPKTKIDLIYRRTGEKSFDTCYLDMENDRLDQSVSTGVSAKSLKETIMKFYMRPDVLFKHVRGLTNKLKALRKSNLTQEEKQKLTEINSSRPQQTMKPEESMKDFLVKLGHKVVGGQFIMAEFQEKKLRAYAASLDLKFGTEQEQKIAVMSFMKAQNDLLPQLTKKQEVAQLKAIKKMLNDCLKNQTRSKINSKTKNKKA